MHQLDSKIAEIQELGGDISELQKAKAKLELDKAQLLKNTSEEIASIKATYQAKILNYESLLTVKEQEIQRLRAENTELASQNEDLSEENTSLKSEKSALANTAARIRAQKEDADIRNKALAEKVSRATALKTEFVKITGINQKGREFDDRRMRNDKLARLKISFMLAKMN
jgi:chromosome segregation ATPase